MYSEVCHRDGKTDESLLSLGWYSRTAQYETRPQTLFFSPLADPNIRGGRVGSGGKKRRKKKNMASLPSGWKADYDGKRWFFTYGPTGQSQFQFPRPGDEFPDLFCCAGAAAALPAVELMPEERLESERQVRRLLNVSGSGAAGSTGEGGVDGAGGSRGREKDGVEGRNVCFESFAAVGSRGRQGFGGSREGTTTTGQRGHAVRDGGGVPAWTSMADSPGESTGETVPVPLVAKKEYSQTSQPPCQSVGTTTSLPIMSEPVLAVFETTTAAPSLRHQGERPPGAATHPSPPELPMLDGRAIESAETPLRVLNVGIIPELYSESTALCEDEISPPPVELPVNEGDWNGQTTVSNLAFQGPVELPAYEAPEASSGQENSVAGLDSKFHGPMTLAGDSAAPLNAGRGETKEKSHGHGHDRAGLPSQASRMSSKVSLDKPSLGDGVISAPGQRPPSRDTDQQTDKFGTEWRDLTHFPSVLRPGPRRSSQPPLQQPKAVMPVLATSKSQAARVRLHQPQEQQQEEKVEVGSVLQGQPARMPAMPPAFHPYGVSSTASTTSREAPRPGGLRQNRLPSSVNFVIPIQHISSAEPSSASDSSKADSPKYRVSASFASAKPSEERPRAGGQAGGGSPGLLPGKKTESWGRAAEDQAAPSHQFVSGSRSAPGVPEWSWGYAR